MSLHCQTRDPAHFLLRDFLAAQPKDRNLIPNNQKCPICNVKSQEVWKQLYQAFASPKPSQKSIQDYKVALLDAFEKESAKYKELLLSLPLAHSVQVPAHFVTERPESGLFLDSLEYWDLKWPYNSLKQEFARLKATPCFTQIFKRDYQRNLKLFALQISKQPLTQLTHSGVGICADCDTFHRALRSYYRDPLSPLKQENKSDSCVICNESENLEYREFWKNTYAAISTFPLGGEIDYRTETLRKLQEADQNAKVVFAALQKPDTSHNVSFLFWKPAEFAIQYDESSSDYWDFLGEYATLKQEFSAHEQDFSCTVGCMTTNSSRQEILATHLSICKKY